MLLRSLNLTFENKKFVREKKYFSTEKTGKYSFSNIETTTVSAIPFEFSTDTTTNQICAVNYHVISSNLQPCSYIKDLVKEFNMRLYTLGIEADGSVTYYYYFIINDKPALLGNNIRNVFLQKIIKASELISSIKRVLGFSFCLKDKKVKIYCQFSLDYLQKNFRNFYIYHNHLTTLQSVSPNGTLVHLYYDLLKT